jgi:hypothetical protein
VLDENPKYKIVSNENCIVHAIKEKPFYPGNPDFEAMQRQLDPLWNWLREGNRRPGVFHYEKSINKVITTIGLENS